MNLKRIFPFVISGIFGGLTVFLAGSISKGGHFEQRVALNDSISKSNSMQLVSYSGPIHSLDIDFTSAAELAVNTVVHVKTISEPKIGYQPVDPLMEFFFGGQSFRAPAPKEGSGSGVFISDDGFIVTNNHVIHGADKVEITLNDKRKLEARIIGTDPTTDLALLKVDGENFPFISYGNSDQVKVGQWVLAVGNPFNLNSTVTAGIVSAKGREINILSADPYSGISPIESFIQTDAAVNPGNSGGALVTTTGELVGINTAIKSNTGSYTGYSFAVPVNIVRKVVGDLMEFGIVQRAFIGVNIRAIDDKLKDEADLIDLNGVYIAGISAGGAADEAGLKEGDVIKKIGAVEIKNIPELHEQLSKFRPGDEVNVSVLRKDKFQTFPIVLRNKYGSTEIIKKERIELASTLGASFEEVDKNDKKQLKIEHGLKIVKLDAGKLRKAGIREGFIILKADNIPIRSMEDLEKALAEKSGGVLIEGIYPNGVKAYYGMGM